MKVLKKTSFESFEQLSLLEAAQLYGGNGDGYPTDPPGCDGYSDCGCSPKGKNPPAIPTPPKPAPQVPTISPNLSNNPLRANISFSNNKSVIKGKIDVSIDLSDSVSVGATATYGSDDSLILGLSTTIRF